MKRVTGIGGIFFKAKDVQKLTEWYQKHLGIDFGGNSWWNFKWKDEKKDGSMVFSIFPEDTDYYGPSEKPYMFNFRVENLDELLKILKEEGVEIIGEPETYPYGKFGWIIDPEGHKIELWEPVDSGFDD